MANLSAIITGAGRGIGRATAVELSRLGYRVGLMARTESELKETARLCGPGALVLPADVADASAAAGVVARAKQGFGSIDAFIHNAGTAPVAEIDKLTPDQWRAIIDTNLSAAYYFCRELWPIWRIQGHGTVVLISSVAARNPFMGLTAYGAAKAGLNALGLGLAREGAAIGVRVHTIAPGAVETQMLRGVVSKEQVPTEKSLDPKDVAEVIVQCVRGELRYTSGEVIYVHKTV